MLLCEFGVPPFLILNLKGFGFSTVIRPQGELHTHHARPSKNKNPLFLKQKRLVPYTQTKEKTWISSAGTAMKLDVNMYPIPMVRSKNFHTMGVNFYRYKITLSNSLLTL